MAGGVVRARLRKGKDDDIAAALEELLTTQDEADIIREALRAYLGLGATRGRTNVPRRRERTAGARIRSADPIIVEAPTVEQTVTKEKAEADLDGLLGF